MCSYKFGFYFQIAFISIGCVSYLTVERVCHFESRTILITLWFEVSTHVFLKEKNAYLGMLDFSADL